MKGGNGSQFFSSMGNNPSRSNVHAGSGNGSGFARLPNDPNSDPGFSLLPHDLSNDRGFFVPAPGTGYNPSFGLGVGGLGDHFGRGAATPMMNGVGPVVNNSVFVANPAPSGHLVSGGGSGSATPYSPAQNQHAPGHSFGGQVAEHVAEHAVWTAAGAGGGALLVGAFMGPPGLAVGAKYGAVVGHTIAILGHVGPLEGGSQPTQTNTYGRK